MTRARVDGYCEVTLANNGGAWRLPRSEFAAVRLAWLKGARFVDTVSLYGSPQTISLKDIDGIADYAPDHLASQRSDKQQDEAEDTLLNT